MTDREQIELKAFVELTRDFVAADAERDLHKRIELLERASDRLEWFLRVVPWAGDSCLAGQFAALNHRIEATQSLIANLYGEDDDDRAWAG